MVSDRVIRDELLTSERYWSVSIEAQRLFIHLLLNADDTARFSGKNYTIRSACFPGQAVDPEKLEKLLLELGDSDLVRLYQADGERFVFVPRFKQRLRFKKSRYPEPPKEINDVVEEKSDVRLTQAVHEPDSSRQKRSEEKRSKTSPPDGGSLDPVWGYGLKSLTDAGIPESNARSFIGALLGSWESDDVLEALQAANGKADPRGYARGVLKNKPKKSDLSRQQRVPNWS